jgi:hypothetical protein
MKPRSSTISPAPAVTSAEARVGAFDWQVPAGELEMREIIRFAWGTSGLFHRARGEQFPPSLASLVGAFSRPGFLWNLIGRTGVFAGAPRICCDH